MSDEHRASWLDRAAAAARAAETALLAILLGGLILFATAQIVLRVGFSRSMEWGDELVRLIVLWLALLGALAASRDNRHITMAALHRWLPPRVQRAAEVCADAFAAVFCAAFAWFGVAYVLDSRSFGDTVFGSVPAWWLQSLLPVVFALIAYRYVVRAANRARGR